MLAGQFWYEKADVSPVAVAMAGSGRGGTAAVRIHVLLELGKPAAIWRGIFFRGAWWVIISAAWLMQTVSQLCSFAVGFGCWCQPTAKGDKLAVGNVNRTARVSCSILIQPSARPPLPPPRGRRIKAVDIVSARFRRELQTGTTLSNYCQFSEYEHEQDNADLTQYFPRKPVECYRYFLHMQNSLQTATPHTVPPAVPPLRRRLSSRIQLWTS